MLTLGLIQILRMRLRRIITQTIGGLKHMVEGYSSRKSNYTACMYVCKGKYKCDRIKNSLRLESDFLGARRVVTVRVRFWDAGRIE